MAYRRATKLVSLPAESKNKVAVAVLPWSVRVTRADVASMARKEMLSSRKAEGNHISSLR
jgi:hypothetical protein